MNKTFNTFNTKETILSNLVVSPTSDNRYRLVEDFIYNEHCVPKGYITNGANIPRILWSYIPPFKPLYMPAVVIHDYYCELGLFNLADDLFEEILNILNHDHHEVKNMVRAVKEYHYYKYDIDRRKTTRIR